ncbi:hypothetical protein [Rhodohalobacter sulfatireducens]|uniref:Uncharacterized protein n=1 Tax=Rhodohalobacter sulfatireducens TaxID=2911366 RepID=A0ABS9K802_9BACT|nr:hypothetical protein [Rhodohalobacter sulfatireducens]MCG2586982.1 hypothetical protein [Rhodohalobacter sulfatireducens]
MFDKIKEKLDQLAKESAERISQFDDKVAEKTDWRPLKRGGKNFGSHSLKEINPNRVEFKSSPGSFLFSSIFMVAGAFLAYSGISGLSVPLTQLFESNEWLPVLAGVVFFLIGSIFFKKSVRPIVFDKTDGMYWKGKKAPQVDSSVSNTKKDAVRLSQVHALQIISESVSSSNSRSYRSYELNLILKDASRLNVIDHGKAVKVREDADKLSAFLGVPVWDLSR